VNDGQASAMYPRLLYASIERRLTFFAPNKANHDIHSSTSKTSHSRYPTSSMENRL
jgi:hypothetical protein